MQVTLIQHLLQLLIPRFLLLNQFLTLFPDAENVCDITFTAILVCSEDDPFFGHFVIRQERKHLSTHALQYLSSNPFSLESVQRITYPCIQSLTDLVSLCLSNGIPEAFLQLFLRKSFLKFDFKKFR